MIKKLNVVFTIDQRFLQHASVTLVSILENNKNLEIEVFIIHNIKDSAALEKVKTFFYNNYKTKMSFYSVAEEVFAKYKISHHVSTAVYFRLLFSDILPKTVDKVLYLDSDIIVTGSLIELTELEFSGNFLIAARDSKEDSKKNIPYLSSLGIPINDYFNSGVMLINLKLWREQNVSKKLIEIANEYMDRITWWDQDILNICFCNKWSLLNPTYNAVKLTEKSKNLPIIIHFNSHTKPWHYLNYHPYKYLYWQCIKLTPFKNAKMQEFTYKRLAKKIIYKLMNRRYEI